MGMHFGYNVDGISKFENIQNSKKVNEKLVTSSSNIRIKTNQNKHYFGEWMSSGELKHMERSDNNVVDIRRRILDAKKKKANIFKYYPPAHWESQEKLIKFTEAKFE